MAKEQSNQSKIIKWFIKIGGTAITGNFPTGEADIQAGYPYNGRLYNVMIETKKEYEYNYLMSGLKLVNGVYEIVDETKLKDHEHLQIFKLNNVRKRGGLALLAYSVEQIIEYIDEELHNAD